MVPHCGKWALIFSTTPSSLSLPTSPATPKQSLPVLPKNYPNLGGEIPQEYNSFSICPDGPLGSITFEWGLPNDGPNCLGPGGRPRGSGRTAARTFTARQK